MHASLYVCTCVTVRMYDSVCVCVCMYAWVKMHVCTKPWWPYLDLEVVREEDYLG